uniref:L1 transposable element RRM domain-containing protein n=1 Tax=Sinocyclocheilus anshuiensis TaxID=1608454 RepID=A0A671MLF2_9TELE
MILRSGAKMETKSKEKQSQRKEADMAGKEVTELLKTLKDEIKEFRREFQGFCKDTKQEIGKLRNDVKELKGTVGDLKMRIQQVEERVAEGEEKQTDYLEIKSRQNNIRIYRIKVGSEGTDIVGFVERLLKEACSITEHLTIVQGHRISATKIPNERPQPRSIVVRFLTWNMKQRVLQAALGKREITYEGNRVYFDQDFTTKILEQRNSFRWMHQKLQEKHTKTHFLEGGPGAGTPTIAGDYRMDKNSTDSSGKFGLLGAVLSRFLGERKGMIKQIRYRLELCGGGKK